MGKLMEILAAPFVLRRIKAARALLEKQTPLKTDCGRLCGGACCQSDESGENGMLLYPFEDRLYRKPIEGFAFHLADDDSLLKGGKRLVCEGACPREARPLACRVFPLRIRLEMDELGEHTKAKAELDPRAWAVCPLLEKGGLRAMSGEFIAAVEQAGDEMAQNVYLLEALENEQKLMDELTHF
ncbi:MAG: hypothetical protein PHY12_13930 [Eubacteriales bacterium]|nr:hypothetical protein [Eubacteriales bacterium]